MPPRRKVKGPHRPPAAAVVRRPSGQVRQCVACRARGSSASMLSLAASAHGGRRAWACLRRDCLLGLHAGQLAHGLKQPMLWDSGPAGMAALRQLASQRVDNLLGLARRAGCLAWGEAQLTPLGEHPDALIFVGDDAPDRRRRALPKATVWPAAKLAQAVGLGNIVAVAIRPGRWSKQAAYWLQLWYETAPAMGLRQHTAAGERQQETDRGGV